MSLFKGTKRIAGSTSHTISDDAISDYSVAFSDNSASTYNDVDSCISAMTTGSQLSKLISVIKAGLTKIVARLTTAESNISTLNGNLDYYYKLKEGTPITSNSNLDNCTAIGNYYCNSNANVATLTNCPTVKAFTLKVSIGTGVGTYIKQDISVHSGGDIFTRTYDPYNSKWTNWIKNITSTDYNEAPIINGSQVSTTVTNAWTSNYSMSLSAGLWMVEGQVTISGAGKICTIRTVSGSTEIARQSVYAADSNGYTAHLSNILKLSSTTTIYLQTWSSNLTSYNGMYLKAVKLKQFV